MATVKDLYTQEGSKLTKVQSSLNADLADGRRIEILATTLWLDELGSFYRAYYLHEPPADTLPGLLVSLINAPRFHEGLLMIGSHPAEYGKTTNAGLIESRYTVFYVNGKMREADAEQVIAFYASKQKQVVIRDAKFAEYISEHDQPAAFISHDSRDKDAYARPLADRLASQLIPVWYDEYSMKVGDNIYESIETGLKVAPNVIVLLSQSFFANASWARQEFLMAIQRHISQKVLLPVWLDVDADDVKRYDLTLAGLVAIRWPHDVDALQAATQVATKLADAIKARRA